MRYFSRQPTLYYSIFRRQTNEAPALTNKSLSLETEKKIFQ
jgi:hypothetical protein